MIPDLYAVLLLAGMTTLQLTIGSWLVSAILALPLALARDTTWWPVRAIAATLTTVLRSVPILVALYVLYYAPDAIGLTLPPLLGAILALGLVDAAYLCEYYHAALLTVPTVQHEAGRSLGLTTVSLLRFVVIPQAIPVAIPPLVNSFVGLLKNATLASALGIPELLWRGRDAIARTGQIVPVMTALVIIYLIVTLPLTGLAANLERRMRTART